MFTIIAIIIFLIIAAISDAVMDVISFKFYESIFSNFKNLNWWNPAEGWKNKYKNRDREQGPAFFGSTTFLVWITDAWHFFQMCLISSFVIAAILGINYIFFLKYSILKIFLIDIVLFIVLKMIYGFTFELFWKKLFIKKS